VQVARQHSLVRADYRKPRVRRRLILTLEKPFRSRQPAAHRRHQGGIQKQVHSDAEGSPRRRDPVASLYARRVCALPRLDGHVEMARSVGDLAENRKIGGAGEALRVRLHQKVEGLLPIAPRRRVAAALDDGLTHITAHRRPA
jgi:hypothetical protein